MHIETEGFEYLEKIIDATKADIQKKYENNKDECNEELLKLTATTSLLGEMWKNISSHFISSSDWRIMRDDEITDGTVCAISFVNECDPEEGYSPDDMPEDSVTMIYCPEHSVFEFMIGNSSIIRLHVKGVNGYLIEYNSEYEIENEELYKSIVDSITEATNTVDESLKKRNEPNVAMNIGDIMFEQLLIKYVDDTSDNVEQKTRAHLALSLNQIEENMFNYFGNYSQWISVSDSMAGQYYANIFTRENVPGFNVNLGDMPDTMATLLVSFDHSFIDVCIGKRTVVRAFIGPNETHRYEKIDSTLTDHEWFDDLTQIVHDAVEHPIGL